MSYLLESPAGGLGSPSLPSCSGASVSQSLHWEIGDLLSPASVVRSPPSAQGRHQPGLKNRTHLLEVGVQGFSNLNTDQSHQEGAWSISLLAYF